MVAMKTNLKSEHIDKISKLLIYSAVAITLVITPWFNKESITVPKLILLSLIASYLLPNLYYDIKLISKVNLGKFIVLVQLLIIAQLIIVTLISDAPFEQQLFGRSGRSLGLIAHLSLVIILLAAVRYVDITRNNFILKIFSITGILVSLYAIMQSFGIDFINWDTRTNGAISTLGNPNFVAAFVAAATIPAIFALRNKTNTLIVFLIIALSIFTIDRTESIQGYLALLVSCSFYLIVHFYHNLKRYFFIVGITTVCLFGWVISGALGHGIFSKYLYKTSVESRGDFWRSAYTTANHNPIFGVGLDSFGDNYLKYRDQVAADHSFSEFTDSAHNYLLDYASQGGYTLAILHLVTIFTVLISFLIYQKKSNYFNKNLTITFCAWLAFQSTFFVSPISVPLMMWSMIFSGAILREALGVFITENTKIDNKKQKTYTPIDFIRTALLFCIVLFMFPLYHTDNKFLDSLNSGDGNLGLKVVEMYPRSTSRYFTVSRLFFESGQNQYSLDVARSAIKFNDKSINAWGLVLVNPLASYEERVIAKKRILELDPFNKEVPNYEIINSNESN